MPTLTVNYVDEDNQIWLKGTGAAGQVWSPSVTGLPSGAIINSATMTFTTGNTYSSPGRTSIYWGTSTSGTSLWSTSGSGNGNTYSISLNGYILGNGLLNLYFHKTSNSSASQSNVYFIGISISIHYTNPASSFTLNSTSVIAGNNVTVSIDRIDASYTHRVTFSFGDRSYTLTGVSTSASYTIPVEWLDQIPNAISGAGTVKVETINGSISLGAKSTSITIIAGDDVLPDAGTLSLQTIDGYWGLCLQGYSKCSASLTGYSGGVGASVSSISISGGGFISASDSLITGFMPSDGTITFTATVKDSRGRSASTNASIDVTAYTNLSITQKNAYRCNADGTVNKMSGRSIAISVSYQYTQVGENAVNVRVFWREYGDNTWTEIADWNNANGYQGVILPDEASVDKRYEIRFLVTDAASQAEQVVIVPPCSMFMVWNKVKNAFGFGTYPEGEKQLALADDWTLLARGRDLASNDHHRCDTTGNTKSLWDHSGLTTRFYHPDDMTNQPTSYGNLLTVAHDTEVSQLWFEQAKGSLYHRQGNATGWDGSADNVGDDANQWVKLVDENNLLDIAYPVGAIYISASSTSPASILGGTWTQLSGRFLLACNDTYRAGSTGGDASVTLSAANLPSVTGQIEFHSAASATTVYKVSGCFSSGMTNANSYRTGGSASSGAASIGKINFSNGGSGTAHNNMPPYLSVYMWQRTA